MAACLDQRGFQRLQAPAPLSPMLLRRRRALKYIDNRSEDKINHSNYGSKTRVEEGRKSCDMVKIWLQFANLVLDMVVILSEANKSSIWN